MEIRFGCSPVDPEGLLAYILESEEEVGEECLVREVESDKNRGSMLKTEHRPCKVMLLRVAM